MLQVKRLLCLGLILTLLTCESDSNDFTPDLGGTGTAGSLAKFTIVDDNLMVLKSDEIIQYAIETGGGLSKVRTLQFFNSNLETIFPYANNVLVGSNNGVHFLAFDSQGILELISTYSHLTACDPVVALNGIAYSTLRNSDCRFNSIEVLDIIDISDIENPQVVKSYESEAPYGLTINGENLFVCERGGLAMYDVSDPQNIILKGFMDFADELPLDVIHSRGSLILRTDNAIYNMSYTSSGVFTIQAQIQ
ncbi:MAG: hypothetical protein HWE23_09730 [Rhodobacteraceae bacterium]|nr:hypothetical protein [Paracoccaceae bacterium]